MHGAPSDSFGRRQIFGTKECKFSVSQRNRGGRGKPVDVQQPKLSGVALARLPVPPLHRAARMADRRPLLAIAGALAANGRALAQTSAAAKGDPVTVQGDVQDAQREVGARAVCGLRNAERFTGRQGIWAMAATIATAVRTSPTANSMLAAVAQFRTTSIPDGRYKALRLGRQCVPPHGHGAEAIGAQFIGPLDPQYTAVNVLGHDATSGDQTPDWSKTKLSNRPSAAWPKTLSLQPSSNIAATALVNVVG